MKFKPTIYMLCLFLLTILVSCKDVSLSPVPSPDAETSSLPTPASTLPELVLNLESDNVAVRLSSIYGLEKYGNEATIAVPSLIRNLYIDESDVRKAAAEALGRFGSNSSPAVPDLIYLLRNDTSYRARIAAADALGKIGNHQAVPDLAAILFDEQSSQVQELEIACAVSIAKLANEKFRDAGSTGVYTTNKNGVPWIVIDARDWWLKKGQLEDWETK